MCQWCCVHQAPCGHTCLPSYWGTAVNYVGAGILYRYISGAANFVDSGSDSSDSGIPDIASTQGTADNNNGANQGGGSNGNGAVRSGSPALPSPSPIPRPTSAAK